MIRVEKRLPYGFVGEWGTVYKLCTFDQQIGDIEYNKRQYVSMEMPVQFRDAYNKVKNRQKIATDLTASNQEDMIETSDAYFDKADGEYKCVVEVGDLIKLGKSWWNVREISENNLFMPSKHTIYKIFVQEVGRELINVKE
jgi:hypothetical protein